MQLIVEITGEREAGLRLDHLPDAVRLRLRETLAGIADRLAAEIRAAEPVRTGKLQSETSGRVYEHGGRIAAVAGVRPGNENERGKAAALDYGSHRKIKMRLTHVFGHEITPEVIERTTDIEAHRFLRGSLDTLRAGILEELREALDGAIADSG